MKKSFLIMALCFCVNLIYAQSASQHCDPAKESKYKSLSNPNKVGGYGIEITKDNALTAAEVEKKMKGQKLTELKSVKIMGKVNSVCKMKGCWMEVDNGQGQTIRIRFKDYKFFVPRDCENQIVYAQGVARFDTTSVAMLQHYAEDAGKSKAEIAAITKPEIALTFEAEGVIFEKK
jgi:Domain of unknown function (DUF4920)